ncbi:MAG: hypothetical protein DI598_11345 [Pseudopedobacter saltans]|uniref:Uncharacterized protein n=1 Tax=Pseudopedobacter saltans TaxID=151895 RepID=A0A2W5F0P1_9SPHI|nr:MAG: hypothetical protein DI598_11345 [Pseudopedobacter saltans]
MIENNVQVRQTINALEDIRTEINSFNGKSLFDLRDVRTHFPNQLNKVLICTSLNLYNHNNNLWNKQSCDEILYTPTRGDHYQILQAYQISVKNYLIYSLSSILEAFYRNILNKLDNTEYVKKNFHFVKTNIFERLNLNKDGDSWKGISILSNIRNTIHNNGVHTSGDIVISNYHNNGAHFTKGMIHYNATFEMLTWICQDIFKNYLEIIGSPCMQKVPLIESMYNDPFDFDG